MIQHGCNHGCLEDCSRVPPPWSFGKKVGGAADCHLAGWDLPSWYMVEQFGRPRLEDTTLCQTYFDRQPSLLLTFPDHLARIFPPHQPCHSLSLNHHYPCTLHCRVRGQSCGAFTSSVGVASGTVNCTMISQSLFNYDIWIDQFHQCRFPKRVES